MSPSDILIVIARKKTVLINSEALRRLLEQREIKQWWLARRIGVDRKTVTRWISGQTQRISLDNLERLAQELNCSAEELTVQDRLEALGTREDRWQAARRLQHGNLPEMVGPSYSWELAEALIRSTLDPEMPLDLQAALYMQLGTCGMYQHKHELVRSSGEIALRKAREAGDDSIAHRAEIMLGNEALMIGELQRAVEKYEAVLTQPQHFDSLTKQAAVTSNLALAYYSRAEYESSLETFARAVQLWSEVDPVISMTTAWYLKAQLHVELSMVPEAQAAIDRCVELCSRIGYAKTANLCIAVSAELASLSENHANALELAAQARTAFETTPNVNPGAHESLIRVLRRAGSREEAWQYIDETLASEIDDRFCIARLHIEKARLLMLDGNDTEALENVHAANALYEAVGAPRRILPGLPDEYYIDWEAEAAR